ncbi:M14 family metallopeptidase [Pontibacter russatus]|uniref:M14 family metallopeptidase n=1 Tax=Pontibacter russatus TaxID=2694929 RepID=UPI001F4886DD|nr:M14 metallopeptidase family protein [Pontibacter russatus]
MTLLLVQCKTKTAHRPAPIPDVAQQAFQKHPAYKEPAIEHRRFKHENIVPLLEDLKEDSLFDVRVVGQSVEGRDIYLVKAGTGKTKVMLWSQMHGDEPTATMALFDLINFLQHPGELDSVRNQILEKTTLYMVPMLNPDGAEKFRRRNALDIDLNRDALRLQSPEACLLKSLRDSLDPDFGFNLHDQSRYYAAGNTPKPATISFLAPAFDHEQTVNKVRRRAMQTIVGMNKQLQQLIPGQVAKYSDAHEPRAFGDNIQKWGTSVILIEAGGYKGDPEKQHIRRLMFATIVSALHLIAEKSYRDYELEDYHAIPENERNLYDVVVRNVRYKDHDRDVLLDVGIMMDEIRASNEQGFYYRSSVQEKGDMQEAFGYEEVNGEGLTLVPGKVYGEAFKSVGALTPERARELLAEGYTTVRVSQLSPANVNTLELPLNVTTLTRNVDHELNLYSDANFVLRDAGGQVRYAIVNGFIYDMAREKPELLHGLVM